MALRYEAAPDSPFLGAGARRCWTCTRRAGRRRWGSRCGWPTRFPPGRRNCWRARQLTIAPGRLILGLAEANGVFAGESVLRRLDRLAQMLGLEAETERQ